MKANYNIKLLIVDDYPEDRYVYKRMLKQIDSVRWTFLEAETGDQGLELCEIEKPDCIILDYILPDFDGLEFMLQMKNRSLSAPVIMLTGQGDETVAVLAIKEGADNYLVKNTLTPTSLKQVILDCVQKNSGRERASEDLEGEAGPENSSANWNKRGKVELVSEIQTLTEKLEASSGIDPLTGLPNRKNMLDKLHHEKRRFERNKNCFSLIMADIDNFDSIRSAYGPEAGDDITAQTGKFLDLNSRAQDMVGRWDNERFLLLLPETGMEGATIFIEKLCKKIKSWKFHNSDRELPITMSFRVGVYDNESLEIEDCIEQADQCLM